jgi:hypothetical protein
LQGAFVLMALRDANFSYEFISHLLSCATRFAFSRQHEDSYPKRVADNTGMLRAIGIAPVLETRRRARSCTLGMGTDVSREPICMSRSIEGAARKRIGPIGRLGRGEEIFFDNDS